MRIVQQNVYLHRAKFLSDDSILLRACENLKTVSWI